VLLILLTAWIAVPKVYIHELFHHNHELVKSTDKTSIQTEQSTDDCEFEKYNKPVYFHIFTFISKLVPVKPVNSGEISEKNLRLPGVSVLISLLRAPPVTE
jgi:hypothetical protein